MLHQTDQMISSHGMNRPRDPDHARGAGEPSSSDGQAIGATLESVSKLTLTEPNGVA